VTGEPLDPVVDLVGVDIVERRRERQRQLGVRDARAGGVQGEGERGQHPT
jgi:hypothetical protein